MSLNKEKVMNLYNLYSSRALAEQALEKVQTQSAFYKIADEVGVSVDQHGFILPAGVIFGLMKEHYSSKLAIIEEMIQAEGASLD